jgi:hypothetical protein
MVGAQLAGISRMDIPLMLGTAAICEVAAEIRRACYHVRDRVGGSDPPVGVFGDVGEVRQSGQRGRQSRKRAGADQRVRGGRTPIIREEVEEERARPRADGDVGQERMHRVTELRAAHEILEQAGPKYLRDEAANLLADRVEGLRSFDGGHG